MADLPLLDHAAELLLIHIQPLVAPDPAEVHGVFVVGAKGHEFVIAFQRWGT